MAKRIIAVLLFIVIGVALCLFLFGRGESERLSQLYVDSETWMQLIADRREYAASDTDPRQFFDAVYFDGYSLACDRTNHMLLYSLIENSRSAYDPSVKVTSRHFDVKVAFLGDGITDQQIRENKAIEMLLYTERYYVQYQLKCTTLPVVRIDIPAADIGEEYVKMQFHLFDNRKEAAYRTVASQAEIHLRGRHSTTLPKNDYRISLKNNTAGGNTSNHHVSLLGMRQDDDWIIKGLHSDKDRVREIFSTNLWYHACAGNNEFGIKNGIDYRLVEVFFDNRYWGIYGLCHPIDEKQLDINYGDSLFKKTGGISEEGIDYAASGYVPGYEYLGKDEENQAWESLRRHYRVFFADVQEAEYITNLSEIVDMENSIDTFLFLNLIQGVDNAHVRGKSILNNMYFAIKRDSGGKERMLYTPWDMDRTWGFDLSDRRVMDVEKNVIMDTNVVTRMLELGNKEIAEQVTRRYWNLRANEWSDIAIEQLITKLENDIYCSGAYARDYEKWFPDSAKGMVRDLAEFRQYVLARFEYMDGFVDALTRFPEEFIESRKKQNREEIVHEVFLGGFTDWLHNSVEADGSVYNGVGYKENTRMSTTSKAPKKAEGWYLTGHIPAKKGDVIRLGNASFFDIYNEAHENHSQIYFFDAEYNYITNSDVYWPENRMSDAWNAVYNDDGDVIEFMIPTSYSSSIAYIRLCARHLDEYSVITVNEEIY
ncbi:MAG: CotH kinase family protein [Clostridia bacterium]|nr:CotH kinase family protein [Clostridia bacterium]